MRTILYVGSSTDLSYEHDLLEEWGKRGVAIAQVSALNADDADTTAKPAPDSLQDVDVVVLEYASTGAGKTGSGIGAAETGTGIGVGAGAGAGAGAPSLQPQDMQKASPGLTRAPHRGHAAPATCG